MVFIWASAISVLNVQWKAIGSIRLVFITKRFMGTKILQVIVVISVIFKHLEDGSWIHTITSFIVKVSLLNFLRMMKYAIFVDCSTFISNKVLIHYITGFICISRSYLWSVWPSATSMIVLSLHRSCVFCCKTVVKSDSVGQVQVELEGFRD